MVRRSTGKRQGGPRRAAILVLTLWIVVVLGMISASLLEEVYLELKVAKFQRDDLEAMALARAGLARAVADLRNDYWIDQTRQSAPFDAIGEVWSRTGEDRREDDRLDVEMGRGKFSVWVDDESAKLPLNAVALNMKLFQTVLLELGMKDKEAVPEIATAVRDWVDQDDTAPTGSERSYYSGRIAEARNERWEEGEEPLYRCKNDVFLSVDELLSVHGVTPELFYGVDPAEETPPNPIEQVQARKEEKRRRRREDEPLGLRDVFSVHTPGAVNVNTADEFTLRVLFRSVVNTPEQAAKLAERIVEVRAKAERGRFSNDNVFRTTQDLTRLAEVPPFLMQMLGRMSISLTVRSDVYRIYALGEVGESEHLICAVVRRSYEKVEPDQIQAIIDNGLVNPRLVDRFQRRWGDRREPIEHVAVRVVQWYDL